MNSLKLLADFLVLFGAAMFGGVLYLVGRFLIERHLKRQRDWNSVTPEEARQSQPNGWDEPHPHFH